MFRYFFRSAIRNLVKNKATSIINCLGLSLGIACCLIIFLVIKNESNFDKFHSDSERIYRITRVTTNVNQSPEPEYRTGISFPFPNILEKELPQAEKVTALYNRGEILLKSFPEESEPRLFKQNGFTFLEPDFFEVLDFAHPDFRWLSGNPKLALAEPNSVIITQSLAEKTYSSIDVLGKSILINNDWQCKITGVISDFPANSDFQFHIMASLSTLRDGKNSWMDEWYALSGNYQCFLKLHEEADVQTTEEKIKQIHSRFVSKKIAEERIYHLQPLSEMHHDTRFSNFNKVVSKETLMGLSLIGLLLLITSGINFSNLSTAQSLIRSKEIGIRKVLGSSRINLILQFLGETYMLTIIAAIIGVGLAELSLLKFHDLLSINNSAIFPLNLELASFLLVLCLSIGLIAGIYPAFVISGFHPINAIKQKLASGNTGKIRFSKGLVLLQFVITQLMIIGTIVIFSQLQYLQTKDLGFQKEAIITVGIPETEARLRNDFLGKISNLAPIEKITFSSHNPMSGRNNWIDIIDPLSEKESIVTLDKSVDENYFETFDLEIIRGRSFNATDSSFYIILNEELVKKLALDIDEAIGKEMEIAGNKKIIIGVVRDFNTFPLHENLDPVVFSKRPADYNIVNLKINPGLFSDKNGISHTMEKVEKAWKENYPDYFFEYKFYDDAIAQFYEEEKRISTLFNLFSFITVFISCLGLYGLTIFISIQRTKEVGIRKVLGASISDLILLLSKNFTLLVVMAFLIAAPIGWFFSERWLENFAYSINLNLWIFMVAISAALFIACSTVAYQAIKTALINPVNSLRSE
ncbi:ABC transporter permease [Flexithrix dorotheae]|uniref:ABC transporter permease n=1 Tax=Flexithrix dorotheae TaxID=70993 RepID=UPI000360C392|nr:ABC transporter permease [Flexithrix dorotheae]